MCDDDYNLRIAHAALTAALMAVGVDPDGEAPKLVWEEKHEPFSLASAFERVTQDVAVAAEDQVEDDYMPGGLIRDEDEETEYTASTEYEGWTMAQLTALLVKRGSRTDGDRERLVMRLREFS
jgi:hypothetical protein